MATAKRTLPQEQPGGEDQSNSAPGEGASLTLLTIAEVSALTRLSATTLRRAIRLRHLGVVRIGRAVRVRQADLEAWLNRNSRHAR